MLPIISSEELRKINKAIEQNLKEIEISLDLGLSKIKLNLAKNGFIFDSKLIETRKVKDGDKSCYLITQTGLEKLQFISHESGKFYKLVPTQFRPILKISGTSMHKKEFLDRLQRDRLYGNVLDSGTGLGYSSIIISKTAEKVTTIEIDENVIEIAKLNPYSRELFNSRKIKRIIGNICQEIKKFENKEFNFVILDGGSVKGSEEFFSLDNYKEVFRVLKPKSKLYHYVPKHQIKRGRDFATEVIDRLKKSGFKYIVRDKEGSYVIASKL